MRFNIKKTFSLSSRTSFVITGIPESGDLNKGSKILNEELNLNMRIHSIEFADSFNEGSLIAITIRYKSLEELGLLKTLKAGDYVIVE